MPAIINQAFSAIEKQLKKTVALRRHEGKVHDGEPRFNPERAGFQRADPGQAGRLMP